MRWQRSFGGVGEGALGELPTVGGSYSVLPIAQIDLHESIVHMSECYERYESAGF